MCASLDKKPLQRGKQQKRCRMYAPSSGFIELSAASNASASWREGQMPAAVAACWNISTCTTLPYSYMRSNHPSPEAAL